MPFRRSPVRLLLTRESHRLIVAQIQRQLPDVSSTLILTNERAPVRKAYTIDPKRSAMMARIGQRDTQPELTVRRSLHRLGYRFRLHRRDLPGTPDITLPRYRLAVLVHGCFWHRHPRCRFAYTPKTRVEFWSRKFDQNVARDKTVNRKLRALGWTVLTVWECETFDSVALTQRLEGFFKRLDGRA